MSDAKPNQEPSMEEILASIRRIISEEEGGQAKSEAKAGDGAQDEDLVLTKIVKPGKPHATPASAPKPEPVARKVEDVELELATPEPTGDRSQETEIEKMPSPTPAPEQEPLVSADVAAASAAAMAQLVSARTHTAVELATPGQGMLVETLVRQAVEPVLRDWLDHNLQAIVERLVRREIERISRRAELG